VQIFESNPFHTHSTGMAKVRPAGLFVISKNFIFINIAHQKGLQMTKCGNKAQNLKKFVARKKKSGHPCFSTFSKAVNPFK